MTIKTYVMITQICNIYLIVLTSNDLSEKKNYNDSQKHELFDIN